MKGDALARARTCLACAAVGLVLFAACSGAGKTSSEAVEPTEEAALRTALSVGDGTARAPEAPDPVQVALPDGSVEAEWPAEPRAAIVAFLSATAPMAGRDVPARLAVCSKLGDPAGLRPVVERAGLGIDALPEGDVRTAVRNDFVAKTRLGPACAADAPGWTDVAFTHPVATRVALEVAG